MTQRDRLLEDAFNSQIIARFSYATTESMRLWRSCAYVWEV